ncbi:MAG TPA: prepilin peptidase [Candidatus Saccharimonadia bacterium]|nr:prepilin peptidase [Candidatus Saccharimonadia bacterium]
MIAQTGGMVVDSEMAVGLAAAGVILGLIFGSAINAMVWRLKVGKSWVRGRSACPDCGHVLAPKDLVPVLSWLALGGKCRYCRQPIKDHPVVELVTALVFGLSAYALAPVGAVDWVRLGFWLVLATMLIVLAVYDARWMILPDKVMLPLMAVGVVYAATMAVATHSPQVLWGALAAALVAGGAFYALVWATKGRAMGGGDIKLAFAMGLVLGAQGTAVAMLVAFNVAAAVGVAMIASRRRGRHDHIPFGPYLVGGTIVAFLWGREIVAWYLRLNGLG